MLDMAQDRYGQSKEVSKHEAKAETSSSPNTGCHIAQASHHARVVVCVHDLIQAPLGVHAGTLTHPSMTPPWGAHPIVLLSAGAEQAGETRIPTVFFSRSLRKTIAAVQNTTGGLLASDVPPRFSTQCLIPLDCSGVLPSFSPGCLPSHHAATMLDQSSHNLQHGAKSIGQGEETSCAGEQPDLNGCRTEPGADRERFDSEEAKQVVSNVVQPVKLLAHVKAGVTVQQALSMVTRSNHYTGPLVLAIGPEGGWTDSEVTILTSVYGYQTVTLATGRTLDTSTATIALVSNILELLAS